MISGINSALSGLVALQKKIESNATNVANVNTDGYKHYRVTLSEQSPDGVTANAERVETPGPMVYEQTQDGEMLVEKSNTELGEELPSAMLTKRFFQANLKTLQTADAMLGSLLDIKG